VQDHLIGLLEDPYLLVQMAAVRGLIADRGRTGGPGAGEIRLKGDRDGRLLRSAQEAVEKLKKGIEEEPKKSGNGK
jgi:hypothetical protein